MAALKLRAASSNFFCAHRRCDRTANRTNRWPRASRSHGDEPLNRARNQLKQELAEYAAARGYGKTARGNKTTGKSVESHSDRELVGASGKAAQMSTQQHGFPDGDMDTESEEMTTANHEAEDAQDQSVSTRTCCDERERLMIRRRAYLPAAGP